MFFLRKEFFKFYRANARPKRWDDHVLLLTTVQSKQPLIRSRFSKTEMDSVLRQERERPLTDSTERTFAFLKPDTVRNRLVGEVLGRLERKGFTFRQLKLHQITRKEAEQLYGVHKTKPFFQELVSSVASGPVVLMVLEAPKAIETLRLVIGATDPLSASPGTVRGDLSVSITANVIHASDSIENAKRESAIFSLDA